jgi:hypothetical protein
MTIEEKVRDTFSDLQFYVKQHKYTVKGNSFESVSNLIKNFVKEFEAEKIAPYSAKKEGISTKKVLKNWKKISKKACKFGTRVHDFGERYASNRYGLQTNASFKFVNQHLKKGEILAPQELALIKFWEDKPDYIVPIILELRMFSEEFGFAGTADLILLDTRDMSLIIGDYKTNKDLYKQYKNQKLLGIFSSLEDMPINKYQIQLSYYQILLKQAGFHISRRFVVWLKEDATYEVINTADFTEQLTETLHKNKIDVSW